MTEILIMNYLNYFLYLEVKTKINLYVIALLEFCTSHLSYL